jgi:hypothetical protein
VILAFAALGLASPAQADDDPQKVLEGVYTFNQEGQPEATWKIWPSCVNVVGDLREPLYLSVACRLHVLPSFRTGSDAVMTGGLWSMEYKAAEGLTCPDGSKAALREIYSFDGYSLTGTYTTMHGEVCGMQPAMTKTPFTLAYKEPLPVPVERYPLYCEPAGLRICQ